METMKWTFYIVFISFISVIILIGLSFFVNRDVDDDGVEFEIAKNYYLDKVRDDASIISSNLEKFKEDDNPRFSARLEVDGVEYINNKNLYTDKPLCMFNTLIKCGGDYEDYYVVDGKLKNVKIDLVMKENV